MRNRPSANSPTGHRFWPSLVTSALLLFSASPAFAEVSDQVAYNQKQVYSAAIRYLRIDLRYEITERDPDAAYVLFEHQPSGQNSPRFGAVEIVKLQEGVRLVVRLPDQPTYQEAMFRDGLLKKLRADYGEITSPSKPPPSKPDSGSNKAPAQERRSPSENPRPNARSQ
jgi:hypothetical protein